MEVHKNMRAAETKPPTQGYFLRKVGELVVIVVFFVFGSLGWSQTLPELFAVDFSIADDFSTCINTEHMTACDFWKY